jgi:hypothetical protein
LVRITSRRERSSLLSFGAEPACGDRDRQARPALIELLEPVTHPDMHPDTPATDRAE